MIQAFFRQSLEAHALQAGKIEVGVQAETERHPRRLRALGGAGRPPLRGASVLHLRGELEGLPCQAGFQPQPEAERIGRLRHRAVGQLHRHATAIGEWLKLPGQIAGEAMLSHRE